MSGKLDIDALKRSARDARTEREADAASRGWADGRRRRRVNRTVAMTVRFSPERRQQVDRLAAALNVSFVELFEKGLDEIEAKLRRESR